MGYSKDESDMIYLKRDNLPEKFNSDELEELNDWAEKHEVEFDIEDSYKLDESVAEHEKTRITGRQRRIIIFAIIVLLPVAFFVYIYIVKNKLKR